VCTGISSSSFASTHDVAVEIINLINGMRQSLGKSVLLVENEKLNQAALGHSQNMANQGVLDHVIGTSTLQLRIENAEYIWTKCAENIAYTSTLDADEVVKMWMDSEGHKKNILGDYKDIGIGIVKKDWRVYYTVVFGDH
jgi:uncharacterized protein YkwD